MRVVQWGFLLRLPWRIGSAPVRARCGGGAAALVAGALEAQVFRGDGSRKYGALGGYGNTLQYSCLENSPDRKAQQTSHSTGSQRVEYSGSNPMFSDAGVFLAFWSSVPVRIEHAGGAAAWVAGTLVVPSVQGHGLPQLQE